MDPRMCFLRLVAGFSNEEVENYYTFDDASSEAEARADRASKRRMVERAMDYQQENLSTMMKVILESMQLQLGAVDGGASGAADGEGGDGEDRIVVLNRDVFDRMAKAVRAENVDLDWARSHRLWTKVTDMASKPVSLRQFFGELQQVASESFLDIQKENDASMRKYANRRQWMEMPINSGRISLRPIIVSALATAELKLRTLARKSDASAEQLMREGPHQAMFAHMVSVQISLIRSSHPTRYLPPHLWRLKMEEQRRLVLYFKTHYFPQDTARTAALYTSLV
jgi:hypothetical protein